MYEPAASRRTRNALDAARKARAEAIAEFWRRLAGRR